MATAKSGNALAIWLIVVVILAFILAVLTYVLYADGAKKAKALAAASSELEQARRGQQSTADENRRLRDVIGTTKETADLVEAERNDLLQGQFPGYEDSRRSFRAVVDWLNDTLRKRDAQILTLQGEKVALLEEKANEVGQALAAQDAARSDLAKARDEQRRLNEDFKARWSEHEQTMTSLQRSEKEALEQVDRMKAIEEELRKLGEHLAPIRRRQFDAAAPDGQPEPWPERVRLVRRELLAREQELRELNATLARLRVADPDLQKLVRDSIPADDRIDGFDGRIAAVNSADRSVLVSTPSTAGMRPGLLMSVFDADDPRPRLADRKAVLEIVQVEGPGVARGRVREDSVERPILPGDGVATSLWAPGDPREVVIVGHVSLRGGGDDMATLRSLVERGGGRVVDDVTPQTGLVVDAGPPRFDLGLPSRAAEWRKPDEDRRKRAIDSARAQGIRVVSLDGLLDSLGLQRGDLAGGRLPGSRPAPPPSTAPVAY
jgi:hypothetical protein